MKSKRPYLLRALNEWILDNGMTPHILVDAGDPGARIPREFVRDGKIIFNISPQAVVDLVIAGDTLSFHARFNGRPFDVCVPTHAVLAIYARENGKGMVLPPEEADATPADPSKPGKKPTLKVVK